MKDILIIHTGGTIGTFARQNARRLSGESINETKLILVENFAQSNSAFAKHYEKIKFSDYPYQNTTLSENMTLNKLSQLVKYIGSIKQDDYDGIVVLHGTDTLSYTAALLSFAFCNIQIPLILVSGNRPPHDSLSNANANFTAAIELIWGGIAPNVYVTYQNTDGVMRLFLGSCIMQSENYTDDFKSGSDKKHFEISGDISAVLSLCYTLSQNRKNYPVAEYLGKDDLSEQALLIKPYTGLDYSIYSNYIENGNTKGIVHGTYHSGTVSWQGHDSVNSIGYLTTLCQKNDIPVFIAPSFLGKDQYETMNKVADGTNAVLINMTTEAAYAKLIIALSCKMTKQQIFEYMNTNINNEFN
ncbi:MAG: asparaginase [Clostridia bacterium]|nr:asparaginase [Clostridia bacterium]